MFSTILPAPALRPFIARYWAVRGSFASTEELTLLPDATTDLVINLGEGVRSGRHGDWVGEGSVLLVGAMLRGDEQALVGEQHIVGVRFRAGGFPCFYRWDPMREAANRVQPFADGFPCASPNSGRDSDRNDSSLEALAPRLDRFFLERLVRPSFDLHRVIADIANSRGQIRIDVLMKRHRVSARSIERHFARSVGITPKQLIDLTRFRHAFSRLESERGLRSLTELALDCGYYDHAHLTNDFKRFTGRPPSRLHLSEISKSAKG